MASKRFPIRILAVVLLLILAIGFGLNWHFRSMAQFNELSKILDENQAAPGIFNSQPGERISSSVRAFMQDEVEFDIHSGLWMIRQLTPDQPRGGNLKWLCILFDYRYALQVPLVLVSESTLEAENQVAKLKGVKQIVILDQIDEEVLRRWKKRFPEARVLTSEQTSEHPYDAYVL